jgi:O-methyltransferase
MEPKTLTEAHHKKMLNILCEEVATLDACGYECGVYQGGTSELLITVASIKKFDNYIRLFDSFEGLPNITQEDDVTSFKKGDFNTTSFEEVKEYLLMVQSARNFNKVTMHKGWIPHTFKGLEDDRISLAYIDVDLYKSVLDCLNFIYPRLVKGGYILLNDYGAPECKGATQAVKEFNVAFKEVKPYGALIKK